jgi:HK97 family phage portal protein
MSIFGRIKRIWQNAARYESIDLDDWFDSVKYSVSGQYVTAETSMRISAVFACVRLLGSCAASSPVYVYKRKPNALSRIDREMRMDHHLSPVLRLQPNETMGAKIYWKRMMQDKVVAGNAYSVIKRNGGGIPIGLEWVAPPMVNVYWAYEIGLDRKLGVNPYRLFYEVYYPTGTSKIYDQDDMIHVPNIGWNGKTGLSTISAACQCMGLALAKEEHSSRFFSQGTAFNLGLEYPTQMGDEASKKLKEYLERRAQGVVNHWKPLIITDGGKIHELNMTARDAQLLESMQASFSDICSFFGVPTVMVRETDKQSSWGTGVEAVGLWFTKFTMNDHFTDFELEMERKLFRDGKYFAEFDETELTRGDTKTLYEAMNIARGNTQSPGVLSINEIRAKLGERPDPDPKSDELYRPEPNKGANNDKSDTVPVQQEENTGAV